MKEFKSTTYEKSNNGFIVGIHLGNQKHFTEIGKLIEKKDAICLRQFSNGIIYYWSKQKLT